MGLFDQVLGSVLGSLSQPQGGAGTGSAGTGSAAANAVLIAIASSAARSMISSATGQARAAAAPAAGGGSLGNVIGTAIGGALGGALANAMHAPGPPATPAPAAATAPPGAPAAPAAAGAAAAAAGVPAGGLGGVLTALGGSAALGALVDQFTQNGHGDMIRSWIQQGPNPAIEPGQLAQALGPEAVSHLTQATGMDTNALLAELARALPSALDQLTPEGRLPTDHEIHAAASA